MRFSTSHVGIMKVNVGSAVPLARSLNSLSLSFSPVDAFTLPATQLPCAYHRKSFRKLSLSSFKDFLMFENIGDVIQSEENFNTDITIYLSKFLSVYKNNCAKSTIYIDKYKK